MDDWFMLLQKATKLIIDEISMVSVYMLDAMSLCACIVRESTDKPFGGLQVVCVGDFLQLPPVYVKNDKTVPKSQGDMAFKSTVW